MNCYKHRRSYTGISSQNFIKNTSNLNLIKLINPEGCSDIDLRDFGSKLKNLNEDQREKLEHVLQNYIRNDARNSIPAVVLVNLLEKANIENTRKLSIFEKEHAVARINYYLQQNASHHTNHRRGTSFSDISINLKSTTLRPNVSSSFVTYDESFSNVHMYASFSSNSSNNQSFSNYSNSIESSAKKTPLSENNSNYPKIIDIRRVQKKCKFVN